MINKLTSRQVIGWFYQHLEQNPGAAWVVALSMYFTSDQAMEEYAWLGQAPVMREWIGGRKAKGFRENGLEVKNLHYEATLEVAVRDLRRDKSGQVRIRINDMATRTFTHWASLMSTLILNGETQVGYDDQYFFDTDHEEGKSGVQSNLITVDISELPTAIHGVPTLPSVAEMQQAILKAITQLMSLKDDVGEPINETASEFLVMVPPSLHFVAMKAVSTPAGTDLEQMDAQGMTINIVVNPRLTDWTSEFAVFRTDGDVAPFIRQEEDGVNLKAKAEGSEFEFDNDAHQYGVDTWRNAATGYWQYACKVHLI